jgi:hypothetical protein
MEGLLPSAVLIAILLGAPLVAGGLVCMETPAGSAEVRESRREGKPASALAGLVRRVGALFRPAGDYEFAGFEAAFRGHGGQFVTQ